jgi:hypothetical protein
LKHSTPVSSAWIRPRECTAGWIVVGGEGGELIYRRPGTPSWVSIMYAHTGVILWADGQDSRRAPWHFAGIDKVDRLVSFLAGN